MLLVASPENQLLRIQEKIDHLDSNILLLTRAISLRTAQKHKRYV